MIPSKYLRLIISRNHKIKLEDYSWSKEFENRIYKIKFKDGYKTLSLKTIFKDGYNIGNCLLTAYYVATIFERPLICTGKVEILKGTKNSPSGDHVWIEVDDMIIDTTLMVSIPLDSKYAKYYEKYQSITPHFTFEDLSYQEDIYEKNTSQISYFYNLYKANEEN